MTTQALAELLGEIRACRVCEASLPLGPRPVLRASATARLIICGQAPGTKVHVSGRPYSDRSGERLRAWLAMDEATFYDESRVAIVPMGFCYPGRDDRGGDLPPRVECAPLWRSRILALMPQVELTLLVGQYAIAWHLAGRTKGSLSETVAAWRDYQPQIWPMPHPSWRNTGWLRRNPWFERDCLPALRRQVHALL
ncbi:MAG TPA: uracil-DNA glycosylase family protein [Candidatus Cybelea sp.]|nr:uracil-DNA glycosylase family protein [Candidatus Cybelea sp.]